MAKASNITVNSLDKFKKTAKPRAELYDGKETGLFYIKLVKGGAWRYRFTFNGKRYVPKIADGNKTPEEARAVVAEWKLQLSKGINPVAEIQTTAEDQNQQLENRRLAKVGAFFDEIYTPHLLAVAGSGQDTLNIIKSNFEPLFNRYMDQLTTADLRAWENRRKKEGSLSKTGKGKPVSRSTLIRALSAFKAMINYAANKKKGFPFDTPVIEFNPISEFKLSAETVEDRNSADASEEELKIKRDLLGEEERQLIQKGLDLYAEEIRQQRRNSRAHGKGHLADLDAVTYPIWFIPFCHVARLTGMRPSDIRRIKWTNIRQDFRTRLMILDFTPNKTKHHANPARIEFPINGELQEVLNLWREQNGNPKGGLIFASERTGGILDKKAYQRHWLKVKQLAGVREDIDFYCFRHNFISDLVAMNFPLITIARLAGHKTTAMIEKIYFRADLDDLAGMAAALAGNHITREHKKVVTLD